MKGVITIFVMPQEIEDLALLLYQLKTNSVFVSGEVQYKVDITLCLSDELTDWENTKLPKDYFRERIQELCAKYLDWCEYELVIENGKQILGCVSQRRESLKKNPDSDFFIWLDCDMLFKESTLFYAETVYKIIKEQGLEMFIVTPQFVKQWDNNWDIIVNKNYWNTDINYHLNNDSFRDIYPQEEKTGIAQINQFKFAGGWFTLITKSLLEKIGIPESFGHYGLEDTFIMACSAMLSQKDIPVYQFIMENLICGENKRYRTNDTIRKYITSKDRKEEFRKIAESNWDKEISNFNTKL